MKLDSWIVAAVVPAFFIANPLMGAVVDGSGEECDHPSHIGQSDEQTIEQFAEIMLPMLPESEQAKIVALGGLGSDEYPQGNTTDSQDLARDTSSTDWLESYLEELGSHSMTDRQVEILREIARVVDAGTEIPPLCFTPGTNGDYVWIINQLHANATPNAYHQFDRWQRTAISGAGLLQGDPTVITYSYVADGTFIPNNAGFGAGNSQLFAWLNSVYGTPAVWQGHFESVFSRWEELTGTSYVYEPNDDGASMFNFFGEVGIRGDVRIGAMQLDGNYGVLAFNFFPDNGDMIFDAFDSFFNNTNSNSLGLRNVIGHEHGHGLGMAHVCPTDETKLMEPFVSYAFDGPQLDDKLNGQRHYGDPFENNDTPAEATDLGIVNVDEQQSVLNVSIDDINDIDFFKIDLSSPVLVTFTVSADADEYKNGQQDFIDGNPNNAYCPYEDNPPNPPSPIVNYNLIHNLIINVYNSDDFKTPIQTELGGLPGTPKVMTFPASEAREYWFEVIGQSSNTGVQRYRIDIDTTGTILTFNGNTPSYLLPGIENPFTVQVDPFEQSVIPGTEFLHYRTDGGAFTDVPLIAGAGLDYHATLPAFPCNPDTIVEYYLSAEATGAPIVFTYPPLGGDGPFKAWIGELSPFFIDDFQADLGWTVSGTIVGQNYGQWERGVPAGDGSRGDAPTDADGSGSCYVTGNGGPGSNTDVDGESTILNSPLFDISNVNRPSVSYWRWYDNTGSGVGSNPSEDVMKVEASDDGGLTWSTTEIETVGPDTAESSGGWFFAEFDLIDALAEAPGFNFATTQFQFRFHVGDPLVADMGPSVIEAAVDGIRVNELACQDPEPVISLPVAPLSNIPADTDYSFEVIIDTPIDPIVPKSEVIKYLILGGPINFQTVPLTHNGGNSYTATIPAQSCNPNRELFPPGSFDVVYFLQVEGEITGIQTYPNFDDTDDVLAYNIGDPTVLLDDSFELDTGWTVSGIAQNLSEGMWERGVPAGDGSRGDPAVDGDGSGNCFVTGNGGPGTNTDVNVGNTILNSPVFDAAGLIEPSVSYWRWYDNSAGAAAGMDIFEVQVSYDGGESFLELETVGPNTAESSGGWFYVNLPLNVPSTPTTTMQLRFIASDLGTGSIVEAAIDGVYISGLTCEIVVPCPADLNGDGMLDFFDVSDFLLAFGNGDPAADFNGDGQFDFFDVSDFLLAFGKGCP